MLVKGATADFTIIIQDYLICVLNIGIDLLRTVHKIGTNPEVTKHNFIHIDYSNFNGYSNKPPLNMVKYYIPSLYW